MGRQLFLGSARTGLACLWLAAGLLGCSHRVHQGGGAGNKQSSTQADAATPEPDGGSAPSSMRAGSNAEQMVQAGRAGGEPDAGRPRPPIRPDAGMTVPSTPQPCDELPQVVDKADLLFVIDNSGSMKEEQESLRQQFPRFVEVLTTGDFGDGSPPFPPAKDLHLGVVSTDLGLVGISDIDKCEGLGDDGIMLNTPNAEIAGCQASYPRFLTYVGGVNDPATTARDFGCIASLGTEGCGFEQQLEAALKALWPKVDPMPTTPGTNRIRFLGDPNGFGQDGQGDGPNAGFLRNDPALGRSLIAVIMVTDEEDCSSLDTRHFTPMHFLDPADPLAMQDLNLRCFFNPQNLYPIERYVNGLKALRPENPALVLFAAVVGVPPHTVSAETRANYDFTNPASREAFYAALLDDPEMQQVVDPNRTPQQGANLVPSCKSERGVAYPPRRIVETARAFGENGVVQSICDADFRPAVDAILSRIGDRLRKPCMEVPE